MQYVSPEYKESMKQTLRNRGYMRVTFGGVASQAQNKAQLVRISPVHWGSDASQIFNNGIDDYVYAMLEENFIKLDGSTLFTSSRVNEWLEKSWISNALVSDSPFQFQITFDGDEVSFGKITFNFGVNYPKYFSISDGTNAYDYENTTGRIFEIDQTFEGVSTLTITITEMINPESRFRLYSVRFDSAFEYQNDMILDSSLESSISPINETLPQMDFSLTLVNKNHYFDTDNPKSILNQFSTATEVNVYYGYQLTNSIEWLQAAKLYVESWSSNKDSATIYAKDILQINDKSYSGDYSSITLYNLAVAIFAEMGITNYSIDSALNNITTVNALQNVSCREALQIVANTACKKLFIKRDGSIRIGEEIYTYNVTSNYTQYYGAVSQALSDDTKYDYATLEENFLKLDGSLYFAPNTSPYLLNGYVSQAISDDHGLFHRHLEPELSEEVIEEKILNLPYDLSEKNPNSTFLRTNPKITITFGEISSIDKININFGVTYASKFTVGVFIGDTLITRQNIVNTQLNVEVELENSYGNKIEIEFVETAVKNNRIRVKHLEVKRGQSKEFTDIDFMTYPHFDKFEDVKTLSVPYYTYSNGEATEHVYTQTVGNGGAEIKWENPLITTQAMAQNLLLWLKEYYLSDGTYEFDTRGDPEIDVNDPVSQLKYTGEKMETLITSVTLGFNGAFSGSVRTLKKGV